MRYSTVVDIRHLKVKCWSAEDRSSFFLSAVKLYVVGLRNFAVRERYVRSNCSFNFYTGLYHVNCVSQREHINDS